MEGVVGNIRKIKSHKENIPKSAYSVNKIKLGLRWRWQRAEGRAQSRIYVSHV